MTRFGSEPIAARGSSLPTPAASVRWPVVERNRPGDGGWTKGTVQRAIYGQKSRPGLPKIVSRGFGQVGQDHTMEQHRDS